MKGDIQRYRLTYILLASSSVVYLFSALLSQSLSDMDMQILVDMGALFGPLTVLKGEWWRLLTAMFLLASALAQKDTVADFPARVSTPSIRCCVKQ